MPYLDDNGLVKLWGKIRGMFATIKYVDDSIPKNTSQLTNDSGFVTQSDIPTDYAKENHTHSQYLTEVPSEYVTESELSAKKYLTSVPSEYVTETELSAKGYQTTTSADSKYQPKGNYLTSVPSEYAKKSDVPSKTSQLVNDSGYITINDVPTGGGGSGGVTSWNDLEDKPFGEIGGDTLTWDGNTEGLASASLSNSTYYHVSTATPTMSDLANGFTATVVYSNGNTQNPVVPSSYLVQSSTTVITCTAGLLLIALEDTTYNGISLTKGTYLEKSASGAYASALTISGYKGFTYIKTIDEKYLPEGIGTGGNVDLSDYQTKTDNTLSTTDKTIVGAINEVKGKSDTSYSHVSNKSNPHNVTLSQLGVNATATELNYVDGVTSSIQNQLNNKANSSHTHPYVSSMSVNGSTLTYNKGDGTTGSVTLPSGGSGGTGGGVTSWNDLEDKPFGEINVSTGELTFELVDENAEHIIENFELEVGAEYTVNWNGVEYKCTAIDGLKLMPDASAMFSKYVFIGNLGDITGVNTGEPFVIGTLTLTETNETFTMVNSLDETLTSVTLSIIYTQLKYLDNKYIKDMYGGGASNTLDFLTTTPISRFNIEDGFSLAMYPVEINFIEDLYGASGNVALTIDSETLSMPFTIASETTEALGQIIDGVECYGVSAGSTPLYYIFNITTDQQSGAMFTSSISKGWYIGDLIGLFLELELGVPPSTHTLTSPNPIFGGGIKYVPNKYLEILEKTSSGGSDTLTWDGNINGKYYINLGSMYYCNVSDSVPTANDFANGFTMGLTESGVTDSITITGEEITEFILDDGAIIFEGFVIIPADNYTLDGITFTKKGVYFLTDGVIYVSSLTIPNYTFATEETYKIKQEYLPKQNLLDIVGSCLARFNPNGGFDLEETTSMGTTQISMKYQKTNLTHATDENLENKYALIESGGLYEAVSLTYLKANKFSAMFMGVVFYEDGFIYVGIMHPVDAPNNYMKCVGIYEINSQVPEACIPEMGSVILRSSTEGSSKKFKITVDDSGTLTATQI